MLLSKMRNCRVESASLETQRFPERPSFGHLALGRGMLGRKNSPRLSPNAFYTLGGVKPVSLTRPRVDVPS